MSIELYTLTGPTRWTAGPELWSSTTLDGVDECPRRWQLSRSSWGPFARFPERYSPTAIEGIIVHEGIDLMSRACGRHGRPSIGSKEFQQALADSGFFDFFGSALQVWNEKLKKHPRQGPFFALKVSPSELTNRCVRLFREQYQPNHEPVLSQSTALSNTQQVSGNLIDVLMRRGSLSETKLVHPSLAFTGTIDSVRWTDETVEIVDFKCGAPKPEHQTQLDNYALLWWRNTGVAPSRVTAQYLNSRTSRPVSEAHLAATEATLRARIDAARAILTARPASSEPGVACKYCPVRARCSDGWERADCGKVANGTLDIELEVSTEPTVTGFRALSRGRQEVNVVYNAALQVLIPPLSIGDKVRVVAGAGNGTTKDVEIKAWTEVFLLERQLR